MELGYLLDAANKFVNTLTFGTVNLASKKRSVLSGLPLGDTVGDGSGTIGLKVLSLGPASGSPAGVKVTPNFASLNNSSQVIPIGAKGWTAIILTGTGSIGGAAVPAGVTLGDNNTLLATVTVTANVGSTAVVYWNT